jgi:formate hydrogenlyase subunit 3/multisubunit Na+/H+ antiporter MnhD subunit
MGTERQEAVAEFKRIMKWIAVIAVLMVVAALTYLHETGSLDVSTIVATTLGVFFSVLLGCGLFAVAFFSSKSGYDQNVTDVTRGEREKK